MFDFPNSFSLPGESPRSWILTELLGEGAYGKVIYVSCEPIHRQHNVANKGCYQRVIITPMISN